MLDGSQKSSQNDTPRHLQVLLPTFCLLSAHCYCPLHHSRENPFSAASHGAPSHCACMGWWGSAKRIQYLSIISILSHLLKNRHQ